MNDTASRSGCLAIDENDPLRAGWAAWFSSPLGLALTPAGTLLVADSMKEALRSVFPAAAVTTLAGSPGMAGTANGSGATARFRSPSGIVRGTSGNYFVTDTGNNTIRRVTPSGVVTTLV